MPVQCTCHTCGKTIERVPSAIRDRNYCSTTCMYGRHPHPILLSADGLTAQIPLRGNHGTIRAYAIVDAGDATWAGQWRWLQHPDGYAMRFEKVEGRRRTFLLHRELLGLTFGDGLEGDHVSRDTLDNRRSNLRIVPKECQQQNHPGMARTSQYRGVCWNSTRGTWNAYICVSRKLTNLGRFDTEIEAADAAKTARVRLMPYAVD